MIKCFTTKYDSNNFISISKVEENLPRYLQNKNMIMINDFLYQFTPYGTIKYKLPINIQNTINDSVIVGSMESTLINDINKYNDSSHILIPYKGKIYQIINNKFIDIRTGLMMDVNKLLNKYTEELNDVEEDIKTHDNPYYQEQTDYIKLKNELQKIDEVYDEMEEKINQIYKVENDNISKEEQVDNFYNQYLYLLNYYDISYIVKPKQVIPNIEIGKKINLMIQKNNVTIIGVIQHFYSDHNSKFNNEYLFLCDNDFFFKIKNNIISELIDFKKTYGFSIYKGFNYIPSCQEYTSILDQLVTINRISSSKKIELLKKLKCINN
jgi:hypothetical protein